MKSEHQKIWKSACINLSKKLSKDVYDRWISVIEAVHFEDGVLVLSVANDFYMDWLKNHYLPIINQIVSEICREPVTIELTVNRELVQFSEPDTDVPKQERKHSSKISTMFNSPKPPRLDPNYTFERFIVGPSNNFAHAAAIAVAQSPARAYNPLFIYGGVGLGKTHIMQAIGHEIARKKHMMVGYFSSEEFTNKYIEAIQKNKIVQFRKRFRNMDALLIDDIQFLSGKDRIQEEFFHTFNALHGNRKQIIMTSDRPASEIPELEKRLVSRFEWGLVTQLESPDVETRIAILNNKEEEMDISLPRPVIEYIAKHIKSNIRRLEGALIRTASYLSLTKTHPDEAMLEKLLGDMIDSGQEDPINMEHIQRTVAEYFDIRFSDMIGSRRFKSIATPRQVAMYLCRDLTDSSLPAIGNQFGKNHATVLHAYRTIQTRMVSDGNLKNSVHMLRKKLNSPA